jgi:hypothetical protein
MEFSKEELRIIETMAFTESINQSRFFIDLANKSLNEGKTTALSERYFRDSVEIYSKLRYLSSKAGMMSEEVGRNFNECGDWCPPNCIHIKDIVNDIPVLHKLKSETTITKS